MKEQLKEWQNHWRKIMGKPINIDVEPSCDFDLHFDIWNLEKEDFFKCFEVFPKGKLIAERAYKLKWGDLGFLNEKLISDEQLIGQTKKAIENINKLIPSKK